ncbi:hypothetical protein CSPX01_09057 [Colletotrichum filicis]|nr:hypothetical protein CSPX01_09057 [Colletotrichum filicis]
MGFQPNWDGKNRSGSGSEEEEQTRRRAGTGDEYHGRSEKRNAGRQSEGGQPRGRGPSGGIGYKRVTCGSRPEDGQEDQLISRVPRARSEEHQNVANANVAKDNRLTRMGIRQSGTARKWEQQPDEMEGAASEGGVEGSVGLALAVR